MKFEKRERGKASSSGCGVRGFFFLRWEHLGICLNVLEAGMYVQEI